MIRKFIILILILFLQMQIFVQFVYGKTETKEVVDSYIKEYYESRFRGNNLKQILYEDFKEALKNLNFLINDGLRKQLSKIKFSKDELQQERIIKKILKNSYVLKLQIANENIKKLNEYLNINKEEIGLIIDKLKNIGVTENVFYFYRYENKKNEFYLLHAVLIPSEGKNLSYEFFSFLAINSEFLKLGEEKDYKQTYSEIVNNARNSIAEILLKENKEHPLYKKDIDNMTKNIDEAIIELSKGSKDIENYKMTLTAIEENPTLTKQDDLYKIKQLRKYDTINKYIISAGLIIFILAIIGL